MSKKPRSLRPDERELWQRVADQSVPINPNRPHPVKKAIERINTTPIMPRIPDFQIGQKARKVEKTQNLTPHITDHLRHGPVNMDRKAFGKMKRGKMGPEAKIDLHGMTLARAHPALSGFIISAHSQNKRLVLVVTGKGKGDSGTGPIPERRGVLRHQVPHWLSIPPLANMVLQITPAHQKHGGDGAYYVYLRRRK